MRAVNVVDEPHKIVMRDCFLIMLKNTPARSRAEDAEIIRRAEILEKDRQRTRGAKNCDSRLRRAKHLHLDFGLFNTKLAEC